MAIDQKMPIQTRVEACFRMCYQSQDIVPSPRNEPGPKWRVGRLARWKHVLDARLG
jgi:hypothetical protein